MYVDGWIVGFHLDDEDAGYEVLHWHALGIHF